MHTSFSTLSARFSVCAVILGCLLASQLFAANLTISSYTVSPAPGFADSGGELTNGVLGDATNFNDPPWVAWQNSTPVLTFDLGSAQTVSGMTIHYMDNTGTAGSTIHAPSAATVTYSTDGTNYSTAGTFSGTTIFPKPGGNSAASQAYGIMSFANVTARYVRVTVTRSTSWLFFDEVTIQGQSTQPDIAVSSTSSLTDGTSTEDFGTSAGGVVKTFTITNTGIDPLTSLSITKDGTNSSEFSVSALSKTTVNSGGDSATFTVTFNPTEAGTRSAAIHIASNVLGAKNPFDINLTGTGDSTLPGLAVSIAGGSTFVFSNERFTMGYDFTLSTAASVSSLGVQDQGGDGLATSHPVGIWDSTGTLVASGTVPAGTAGLLKNGFRYVSITPVTLPPGSYRAGALFYNGNGNDSFLYNVSSVTPNPLITYGGTRGIQSNDQVLHYPTLTGTDIGLSGSGAFGPNFILAVVPNNAPTDITSTISGGSSAFPENNVSGATVATLSTTDADSADTFTYSLVSGTGATDNAAFTINGNALKAAVVFDYETQNSYSVRIRSTDQAGAFVEKALTVSIANVNEAPSITGSTACITVNELDVATRSGTFADPEGNVTLSSNFGGIVQDDNTGTWTWNGAAGDAMSTNVVITITDSGGLTNSLSFSFTALDITPPVIATPADITVVSDASGHAVVNYSATANDAIDGARAVTFSPASGSTFNTGTTTVTCTSTDTQNNTATTTFTVTVVALDYSITTENGVLTITDLTGHSDVLALNEADTGLFTVAAPSRTFRIDSGNVFTSISDIISFAGATAITINAGMGDDTVIVGDFPRNSMPNLTINGGTGDDSIVLNGSMRFALNAGLDIDLQNDSATPGIDRIIVGEHAHITMPSASTGNIVLRCSRNIQLDAFSRIELGTGSITLEANQQAVPTTGDFAGIFGQNTSITTNGNGAIIIKGKGGSAGNAATTGNSLLSSNALRTNAVQARALQTKDVGPSLVASAPNAGIRLLDGSSIDQTGGGSISFEGTSIANGDNAAGIVLEDSGASTSGGDLILTAAATGTGEGDNRPGIMLSGAQGSRLDVNGSGDLTITANGAPGSGDGNAGISVNGSSELLIEDGTMDLLGQGGQGDATTQGTGRPGIDLKGSIVSTGTGNIALEGHGGTSSSPGEDGVTIGGDTSSTPSIMTQSGDVSVVGDGSGNAGDVAVDSGGAQVVSTGEGGNTEFKGDHITVTDSSNSGHPAIASGGNLNFTALTAGAPAPITLNPQTITLLSTGTSLVVNNTVTNHAPTALNVSNVTIDENNAVGFNIGALSFIDADSGQTPIFGFAFGSGDTDNALFTIVGNTLQAHTSLDADARTDYSVRLNVSDGFGGSFQRIVTIHVNDLADTPSQLWKQQYFGSFANTGNTADTASFTGDGVPNLLKFAFGVSPLINSPKPLSFNGSTITPGGITCEKDNTGTLLAEWVRRKDYAAAGLVYTVQFSADLVTWESDATSPNVLADDGTNQVVGLSYPILTSGAQAKFFQVTVGQ